MQISLRHSFKVKGFYSLLLGANRKAIRQMYIGCCSVAKLCLTLCEPMDGSMPGFPVLHCLLESAQTYVHWVSDAIQPSCPLSPPSPPALNLSQHQGLFQWVGYEWPKYWIFSFSIDPSNVISFRVDRFDDLAVQGALKSFMQHHNSKASVLWSSASFMVIKMYMKWL